MIDVPLFVLGNKSSPSCPGLHLSGPRHGLLSRREVMGLLWGPIDMHYPVCAVQPCEQIVGPIRTDFGWKWMNVVPTRRGI